MAPIILTASKLAKNIHDLSACSDLCSQKKVWVLAKSVWKKINNAIQITIEKKDNLLHIDNFPPFIQKVFLKKKIEGASFFFYALKKVS